MNASANPLADEFVTFIQHALPGLEDGTYELEVSQRIEDADGQPINQEVVARTYTFAVTGDRFRLSDPGATIASCFPASNATGEFNTVLPHVVFNTPTFPWARYPTDTPPVPPAPGADTDLDVPTWLAILVLDADDMAAHATLALEPLTGVLGDLFPPAAYAASKLGENYSYFTGASDTSALEIDESVSDPVQTIDVPLTLFADIAPTLADLALSAHVRCVSIENKPLAPGAEPPADPLGSFAIVFANRLPAPESKSHAYLVSLEGMSRFLPATSDGGTLNDPTVDLKRSLRLAVLAHWTFNTKGESATFVERLEALNRRSGGAPDAVDTNLRLLAPGASPPISGALDGGYVPLNHQLRTGETTVSWYRGPLSPRNAAAAQLQLPISSPDQALTLDPTTGMFDASLAAAWTLGRLLALQDKSYSSSLYAWKKALIQMIVDAAERRIIDEILGTQLAGAPEPAPTPATAEAPPPAPAMRASKSLLEEMMRAISAAGTGR
jgi:hypothetical protein